MKPSTLCPSVTQLLAYSSKKSKFYIHFQLLNVFVVGVKHACIHNQHGGVVKINLVLVSVESYVSFIKMSVRDKMEFLTYSLHKG